jgi:hypothetical protein
MAFSGKMNDNIDLEFGKYFFDVLVVNDVAAIKKVSLPAEFILNVYEVREIPRIGQFVVINEDTFEAGFFENVPDEIRADESRASRYQDVRRSEVKIP